MPSIRQLVIFDLIDDELSPAMLSELDGLSPL